MTAKHLPSSAPLCISWRCTIAPCNLSTGEAVLAKQCEPRRVRQQLPFIHFPLQSFLQQGCFPAIYYHLSVPALLSFSAGAGEERDVGWLALPPLNAAKRKIKKICTQNSAKQKCCGSPQIKGEKETGSVAEMRAGRCTKPRSEHGAGCPSEGDAGFTTCLLQPRPCRVKATLRLFSPMLWVKKKSFPKAGQTNLPHGGKLCLLAPVKGLKPPKCQRGVPML